MARISFQNEENGHVDRKLNSIFIQWANKTKWGISVNHFQHSTREKYECFHYVCACACACVCFVLFCSSLLSLLVRCHCLATKIKIRNNVRRMRIVIEGKKMKWPLSNCWFSPIGFSKTNRWRWWLRWRRRQQQQYNINRIRWMISKWKEEVIAVRNTNNHLHHLVHSIKCDSFSWT